MKPLAKILLEFALPALMIIILMNFLFPIVDGIHSYRKKSHAKNDVQNLCLAMRAYFTEYGALPSGDSVAIIRTLQGSNPKKIPFIELPENQFDAQGEFLDHWKTPYRIDISDPANPKAWSAGPNKKDEPGDPNSDDICSWR